MISTFLQFLIVLKLIFFCTNNCGMIPWFSQNHNVAGSDMNSITYLPMAYKRNYVLQKVNLKKIDRGTRIEKNGALIGLI